MNLYLVLLSSFLSFFTPPESKVEWISPMEYDFGDIEYRKPVRIDFKYKNVSAEPVVIDNIRAGCGCTAPEWAEVPVEPDSTGMLTLEYDARKTGYFRVAVRVFFSGQRRSEKLYIEGYVME
jgi:hypothetical protein